MTLTRQPSKKEDQHLEFLKVGNNLNKATLKKEDQH